MHTYTRISIRQSAKTQLKQWRTETKLATLRVSDSFLGKDAQETREDSVRMHNAFRTRKPFRTCRTRRYVTTRHVLAFTKPPGARLPRATESRPNSGDFANLHQLHMHIRNTPCTQLDHSTALEALAAGSCTHKTHTHQTHTRIEKGVRNKTPKKISVLHSHQQIAGHTRTRTRTRTRTHAHALTRTHAYAHAHHRHRYIRHRHTANDTHGHRQHTEEASGPQDSDQRIAPYCSYSAAPKGQAELPPLLHR